MKGVVIRQMEARDRESVTEFFWRLSRETFYNFGSGDMLRAQIVERMLSPETFSLVAFLGEKVVGIGELFLQNSEIAMAVADEYQHQGIGSLLFAELKEQAEASGLKSLYAEVLLSNTPACCSLKRYGFKTVAVSYVEGISISELKLSSQ